jgi:hypothetical protein
MNTREEKKLVQAWAKIGGLIISNYSLIKIESWREENLSHYRKERKILFSFKNNRYILHQKYTGEYSMLITVNVIHVEVLKNE